MRIKRERARQDGLSRTRNKWKMKISGGRPINNKTENEIKRKWNEMNSKTRETEMST